jgi:hypothetical protein
MSRSIVKAHDPPDKRCWTVPEIVVDKDKCATVISVERFYDVKS